MTRRHDGGVALPELLLAVAIASVVLTFALLFFTTARRYYSAGVAQVDVQTSSQQALTRLWPEVQESNLAGLKVNAARNALLLISARDSANQFQFYNGPDARYVGQPVWQKWVAYYLDPRPRGPYSTLVRKEGNLFGSGVPTTDASSAASSVPADWDVVVRNLPLPGRAVARDIETFDLEDINCGTTGNPFYLQIVSRRTYGGLMTSFSPGGPAPPFSCGGKTGNWMLLKSNN